MSFGLRWLLRLPPLPPASHCPPPATRRTIYYIQYTAMSFAFKCCCVIAVHALLIIVAGASNGAFVLPALSVQLFKPALQVDDGSYGICIEPVCTTGMVTLNMTTSSSGIPTFFLGGEALLHYCHSCMSLCGVVCRCICFDSPHMLYLFILMSHITVNLMNSIPGSYQVFFLNIKLSPCA